MVRLTCAGYWVGVFCVTDADQQVVVAVAVIKSALPIFFDHCLFGLKKDRIFLIISADVNNIGTDTIKIKTIDSTLKNIRDLITVGLVRSNITNSNVAFIIHVIGWG